VTLDELNRLDDVAFTERLGHVAEGSPWVAEAAARMRPFADRDALTHAFAAAIEQAPAERRVALVRAHPDLAGRAALAGDLAADSAAEQASAGLDRLTPAQLALFEDRNGAYRGRFGFPFVMRVRGRGADEILAAYAVRLGNTPEQELRTACAEIAGICELRLRDLVDAG